MPKLVSIDNQRYAALTLQSLRVTIGPLQASTTSLESQESYLTAGMLPYNRNVTLQTFLSSTRDFNRLHSTFARLYNAAASPASRLRSAGSLAIIESIINHYLTNKEAKAVFYTVIKHDRHLRTRGKCRKHEPQASVFYISRVFSNDWSVLSRCNTLLRLLHLLYDIDFTRAKQ